MKKNWGFVLVVVSSLILAGCGGGNGANTGGSGGGVTFPVIPYTECTPGGPGIPCTYWGIHVNQLSSYPLQIPYGEFRGWDSGSANWPELSQNCTPTSNSSCFDWTNLDAELANVKSQGGVTDVFYTLSRTPQYASLNPVDSDCNYSPLGQQYYGECDPPIDVALDGTGADLYWRTWVAAIAARVTDPTYVQTHAHIKYWEVWNEFNRSSTLEGDTGSQSWKGSYSQLFRMIQDARCLIIGSVGTGTVVATGETCAQVQATVGLAAPVDPSAKMVSNSVASSGNTALNALQNLLYCNSNPRINCTAPGAAQDLDIMNVHLYVRSSLPESVSKSIPAIRSIMQPAERAKPLWNGEGSWGNPARGDTFWTSDAYAGAGFIPRYFAMFWSAGLTENFWYGYDFTTGQLFNTSTGKLNQPQADARIVTYNWLSHAVPKNNPFCQSSGSIYYCDFTEPSGTAARLIWDSGSGQRCSSSATPIICGNTAYSVPAQFNKDWIDLLAEVHPAASSVTIGSNPILLEGQ